MRDWDGMPVDQAIVKVRDDDLSPTVITDATGFYETALALDPRHFASWISIRREGYEDLENAAIFTNGQFATSDYVLFPKTTVTAGSTAPVRFVMNGPLCGFDLEYPCRHLTIVAPVSGTLVMETLGNSEAALYFGPIDHYPFVGATERSIPVTAGDKVPIELLWGRPTTRQTSAVVTEGTLVTRIDH